MVHSKKEKPLSVSKFLPFCINFRFYKCSNIFFSLLAVENSEIFVAHSANYGKLRITYLSR